MSHIVDRSGNTNSFSYDEYFRLIYVTDALGLMTTNFYELTNDMYKITRVSDPFGRYATFDYNTNGQLVAITDILGLTSEFEYDANDFITSLTTPYGTTTFEMGETNRTRWLEVTDPLGEKERIEYQDKLSTVPYWDTNVPDTPTDLQPGLLNVRNTYYWDKKAMQEAPGDYSKAHIYHWLHATLSPSTASRVLESEKAPLEARVWYSYPGQSSRILQGYSSQPSIISRVLDDGTTQAYHYTYSTNGRVIKFTDPSGRATTNVYDSNLIDLLEVRQIVDSSTELLASFTYNSQHLPLSTVSAADQTNHFGYNSRGQLVATTNALGETVTMEYDEDGYPTNITGSVSGAVTSFTYDGTNRLDTVTDSEGFTLSFDYDEADRITKITYPDDTYEQMVYDRLDLAAHRDRLGRWTRNWYDPLQRLTQVEDALGRITQFDWCGCGSLESITDPMGRVTAWIRDIQGRVTTKIYPDTSQVNFAYEERTSRLASTTDALGQSTLYEYLVDDNLQQMTYTNAVVSTPGVSYLYDSDYNRLTSMTDGEGTTTYTYYGITNALPLGAGRLATVDGPWDNDVITFTYDELGRVKSRSIDDSVQELTYDALGRVTQLTNVLGGFTNSYVNATFRPDTNFFPNGQTTLLDYFGDTNDFRLSEIKHLDPSGSVLSKFNYTYDAFGQISTWTQQTNSGPAQVYTFGYDAANQLIDALLEPDGGGSVIKDFAYAYDAAGNRTGEQIDSYPSLATHNDLNQLISVGGGGPTRFAGNISETGAVWVAGSPAVMSANTNFSGRAATTEGTNTVQLIATDLSDNWQTNDYQVVITNNAVARTLTYDDNGNLVWNSTDYSTNLYEWDAADRLVKITRYLTNAPVRVSEFEYNGAGMRIRQTETTNGVAESELTLLWCGLELCEERDSDGDTVAKQFFGGGERTGGTNYYYLRDHLGSVREMTDDTGAIQARYDYDPYGRRTILQGGIEATFGFTGHYVHVPSSLHLAPYRAYDAELGRWPNRDPIGEEGGFNVYGFVTGNPVSYIDRWGLDSQDVVKVLTVAKNTTAQMTDDGKRLEGGTINNFVKSTSFLPPMYEDNKSAKELLGCGQQSVHLLNQLMLQDFNDSWKFDLVTAWGAPLEHQFIVAHSSNPNDPWLLLDPHQSQFMVIPHPTTHVYTTKLGTPLLVVDHDVYDKPATVKHKANIVGK